MSLILYCYLNDCILKELVIPVIASLNQHTTKGGEQLMKYKLFVILTLMFGLTFAYAASDAEAKKPSESIIDIVLVNDGEFDVLQAAVIEAGLVDALSSNKQMTVFAPTDQAFIDSLGATDEADAISIVQSLDQEDLTNILLYHVTNGRRNSTSVLAAPMYNMLNGDKLQQTELLDAGISATDVQASNGIIHVIDSVLMPE